MKSTISFVFAAAILFGTSAAQAQTRYDLEPAQTCPDDHGQVRRCQLVKYEREDNLKAALTESEAAQQAIAKVRATYGAACSKPELSSPFTIVPTIAELEPRYKLVTRCKTTDFTSVILTLTFDVKSASEFKLISKKTEETLFFK